MEEAAEPKTVGLSFPERKNFSLTGRMNKAHHKKPQAPVELTILVSAQIILTCTEKMGGFLTSLKINLSDSFLRTVYSANPEPHSLLTPSSYIVQSSAATGQTAATWCDMQAFPTQCLSMWEPHVLGQKS